jgi:predicted dehydrogenase
MAAATQTDLKIAVVGAGYFSQFHYEAWRRLPGANLVALADSNAEAAHATAARFEVPKVFESLDALLAEVEPDILDIVTPPQTHHALVAAACRRARLVVCQKPLAPSLEEARAIVRLAADSDCPLAVHENFRFQPWFREAKAILESGKLGTPHAIAFRLRPGDGQGPEAYLARQPYFQTMPRFLIHETGVHFVDVFRYLLGKVAAVTARLRRMNPAIAGEDAGYVIFEFANGAGGVFDGNRLNDHMADNCRRTMGEMHLEGSGGVLRLDGMGRLWLKPHGRLEEAAHEYDWTDTGFAGDCVYRLNEHLVAHMTRGAALENDGAAYLRNVEIVEAIYRSHETGQRMVLDAN